MYMNAYAYPVQRGNGLGNLFASLFRTLKPLAASLLGKTSSFLTSPTVKSGVSSVAQNLVDVGMNKLEKVLTKKADKRPRSQTPSAAPAKKKKKSKPKKASQSKTSTKKKKSRATVKTKRKRKTLLD